MACVGDLTTYILGAFKSDDDGRVALYHYLKNFYPEDITVRPELINDFYSEALHLHHWQEKQVSLQTDVQDVLQRFFSQNSEPFRLDQLWDLSRLQLISLSNSENLCQIVREFEQDRTGEGENIRVILDSAPDCDTHALSIRRTPLGEVVVRTYGNLVRIQGSKLFPLCPSQEVFYDPGMELKRGLVHKLKTGTHSQVRFIIDPGTGTSVSAQFINGFAFRQTQSLSLANINQESRIFFPLKRLERFYIYRPSDPYYMELISTMERALLLLQTRREGAYDFARQAFDGGQIAFDQIFPDDKALYTRLRELAKWITSPGAGKGSTSSETTREHESSPSP